MVQYEETDDRKILRARECRVLGVENGDQFIIRLTGGVVLEFSGLVLKSLVSQGPGDAHPIGELPPESLDELISTRPLSWVVFNSADQRIVFSNRWHLDLDPHPDGHWRLELGDGRVLEFPEAKE